jgi:hypothetical protein
MPGDRSGISTDATAGPAPLLAAAQGQAGLAAAQDATRPHAANTPSDQPAEQTPGVDIGAHPRETDARQCRLRSTSSGSAGLAVQLPEDGEPLDELRAALLEVLTVTTRRTPELSVQHRRRLDLSQAQAVPQLQVRDTRVLSVEQDVQDSVRVTQQECDALLDRERRLNVLDLLRKGAVFLP